MRRVPPLVRLLREIPTLRAVAVERGELDSVWPGAAADIASLIVWRGLVWPVVDVLHPPRGNRHPGCPLCDPPTYEEP